MMTSVEAKFSGADIHVNPHVLAASHLKEISFFLPRKDLPLFLISECKVFYIYFFGSLNLHRLRQFHLILFRSLCK